MNIILFSPDELKHSLPLADARLVHVRSVLQRSPGESFDAGLRDGPRGEAWFELAGTQQARIFFRPLEQEPPPLPALICAVAYNRPQAMRRILVEGTALGLAEWHFFPADRGDPNYRKSRLWETDEADRRLVEGVAQAFTTRFPKIVHHPNLVTTLRSLEQKNKISWVLDNYDVTQSLGEALPTGREQARGPVILWLGPERGWSGEERAFFSVEKVQRVHLGPRVLRSDTALLAAQAMALNHLGYWSGPTPSGCRWHGNSP